MRGLYGKVLSEDYRTDRATKERYFPVQTEQTRLIRDLLYGFVGSQFVLDCSLYWTAVYIVEKKQHFRCYNFQPYILPVSGSALAVTTKQ